MPESGPFDERGTLSTWSAYVCIDMCYPILRSLENMLWYITYLLYGTSSLLTEHGKCGMRGVILAEKVAAIAYVH